MKKDDEYKERLETAWTYFEDNDFEKAKEEANYLIKNFPQKNGGLYLLGLISNQENEYEKSISYFKKALNLDFEKRNGGFINYWLGKNYNTKQSDYDFSAKPTISNPLYNSSLAICYYENALEFEDYPEEVIKELIRLLNKDYFKINNILKKAIVKFPTNGTYILQAYNNFLNLNKEKDGLKLLIDKSNELNLPSLYFKLGQILFNGLDYKGSRVNYEKSLELCVNNGVRSISFINYNIANTYFKEENWDKALHYYLISHNVIIDYNFENPDFKYNDFWVCVYGVIACLSNLKRYDEIEEFILGIPFLDEYIDYVDFELIFSLDNDYFESTYDLFYKKNIALLNQIKRKSKNNHLTEKVLWLMAILYENAGLEEKRLQVLRDIGKLDYNNSNVLINNLTKSYFLCIEEKKSKKDELAKLVYQLKTDLQSISSFKDDFDCDYLSEIMSCLFSELEYQLLIDLKKCFTSIQLDKANCWFEIAYSFNEINDIESSEKSYEYYLLKNKDSGAALNNLANIYKEKKEIYFIEKAIEMYKEAIRIGGNEELYNRNLKNSKKKLEELLKAKSKSDYLEKSFQSAIKLVKGEDYFTLEILYNFLLNIRKEEDYHDNEIPIQIEYFPTLMNTSVSKSEKLRELWISKNYIFLKDESDDYNIPVYLINPYLEDEVVKQRIIISKNEIPSKWIDGIDGLNIVKLEEIQYFNLLEKVNKTNKKFRGLIERDFNELVFNYLIGNIKSTIVLSGSFVELILTYYLERKKNSNVQYSNNGKNISKELYDCNLFDLISFAEEKGYFGKDFFHLTNLSRIYRNFVHPGLELKNELTKGKSDLCFISTMEILKLI